MRTRLCSRKDTSGRDTLLCQKFHQDSVHANPVLALRMH